MLFLSRQLILSLTCIAMLSHAQADTRIRIQGLQTISEDKLLDTLHERLTHVREQPPAPSRASDAAFILENLLFAQGFVRPTVTWSIPPGRNELWLQVQEGQRFSFGGIDIPQLPEKEATRLAKLFRSSGEQRRVPFSDRIPFRESDLTEGLSRIERDYHARGYWAAKATVQQRTDNPQTGEVHVVIHIDTGNLHKIAPSIFSGNLGGLDDELSKLSRSSTGKDAVTANINKLRLSVEDLYRRQGFQFAKISLQGTSEDGRFVPSFMIEAGQRYNLRSLTFQGLNRTNPERIQRRFDQKTGVYYDASRTEKAVRDLLGTGAFSSVRTSYETDGDQLDTTIIFDEANARGYSFYAGVGSYDGTILGMRYHDRNFRGNLWNLNAGAEINSRGILGEVRVTDPWFLESDVRFSPRVFALTRDYDGYDKFETGGDVSFTYSPFTNYQLVLRAGTSLVNIEEDGLLVSEIGETVYTHQFIGLTQTYDRRNSPLNPTRGYVLRNTLRAGSAIGEDSCSYLRGDLGASWYTPVDDDHHLAIGLRAGTILPSGSPEDLPVDLRNFLGGPTTVRSFRDRELGPRGGGNNPLGGESYWIANVEYVHEFKKPIQAVIFTDIGSLSEDEQFEMSDPEVALGVGLRLDLPVGPVRLEYGRNMTKDRGETSGTFHFSIGIAF